MMSYVITLDYVCIPKDGDADGPKGTGQRLAFSAVFIGATLFLNDHDGCEHNSISNSPITGFVCVRVPGEGAHVLGN